MRVFLYGQRIKNNEEFEYVKQVIEIVTTKGGIVFLYAPVAKEFERFGGDISPFELINSSKELEQSNIELAITLGGDGTILQAITMIKKSNIPILGINLGRLGFLANVEKRNIEETLSEVFQKNFKVVNKSLIGLKCNMPLFGSFPYALNDFTLNKRDTSSMITIHAYVDNELLTSYWADGIIISTPTGSTGYSLSCGGPIVFPDSQNFVITPVAPHNLNVRPIVISDSHKITLEVEGRTDSFMCTLDSRYETITSAHKIEIAKADFGVPFVQVPGLTFMKTLSEKLYWGYDKRN